MSKLKSHKTVWIIKTLSEWLIKLDVWDEYCIQKTVKYCTTAMRCLDEAIQRNTTTTWSRPELTTCMHISKVILLIYDSED